MAFEISAKMLFSDTDLPDIFIKEFVPVLDGDSVRVYIYCVFIAKKGLIDPTPIGDILGLPENVLGECLTKLESFGLISQKSKKIVITDLKERELNKYYRPKTALDTDKPVNKRISSLRQNTIKYISDTFFAGQMSNTWYSDIDLWYETYGFDDAVMAMLFTHCSQTLSKSGSTLPRGREYVKKAAGNWAKEGIKTQEQLERYLVEYDKYKIFKNTIAKKANIKNLDDYQEVIISKWYFTYKYTFDIVEEALKKSQNYKNSSLSLYDKFITEWYNIGLNTKEAVLAYEEEKRKKYQESKGKTTSGGETKTGKSTDKSGWNYEYQRKYDDEYFDELEKRWDKE